MSEYIKKQEAIEAFSDMSDGIPITHGDMISDTAAVNVIKSIPSADVRENMHARWEETSDPIDSKYGKHNYVCPKCFRDPLYFVGGTEDWWCIDKPHFCPNCGADMSEPKGEKEINE